MNSLPYDTYVMLLFRMENDIILSLGPQQKINKLYWVIR
jgi:hypothetical protein